MIGQSWSKVERKNRRLADRVIRVTTKRLLYHRPISGDIEKKVSRRKECLDTRDETKRKKKKNLGTIFSFRHVPLDMTNYNCLFLF